MSKKVFISSPVFDLVDVRAELAELLRSMGLKPVLSDVATSDFNVLPDANSIETCLVNVEASDYFLCVLSQRYGPKLSKAGTGLPDVSATHLEYRRAKDAGKPILFYVRDRLESEYAIWKRNDGGKDLKLSWVKSTDDYGLFDLLQEHRALVTDSARSNWFAVFQSSVDLKEAVRNHLRLPETEAAIRSAIEQNRIPILDVKMEVTKQWWGDPWKIDFSFSWTNVGTIPGLNVRLFDMHSDGSIADAIYAVPVLAPGQEIRIFQHLSKATGDEHGEQREWRFMTVLQMPNGVEIHDTFVVFGGVTSTPDSRSVSHSAKHLDRQYVIPPVLELGVSIVQR
ncbi:MAG: DUF4062 domain-containing protein [Kiritimatiellia bacterium]|nr:DUF4062 domain-containing protein [Kiritimatiellia bacterium]